MPKGIETENRPKWGRGAQEFSLGDMDSGGKMKSSAARHDEVGNGNSIAVGGMAKRDAAKRVAEGYRHVHSSPLGPRDPAVQQTEQAIANGEVPRYAWELA